MCSWRRRWISSSSATCLSAQRPCPTYPIARRSGACSSWAAGQRRSGFIVPPQRADLALDAIPTLSEHKTRAKVRVRLVASTKSAFTVHVPDVNAILAKTMCIVRSMPSRLVHGSTAAQVSTSAGSNKATDDRDEPSGDVGFSIPWH